MNAIGINTWAWVAPLTDDALAELAPRVAAFGFDAIELPVQSPGDWDPDRAADLLRGLGLAATVCAGLLPGHDLLTGDAATLARTVAFVRHCVDVAARSGATVVAGPLYCPAGRTWPLAPADRPATVALLRERLAPLAGEAEARGVTLALEPLNRFDGSLLNTVEQTLEVVDGVPGLGVALDTFHLNIEERDLSAAIRATGRHLVHLQVCANDRGTPGEDHLDWAGIVAALRAIGYAGPLSIESFLAPGLAVPMSVWRPLAAGPDQLATRGLAFLRAQLA
jgi:D-psicose/D-tagatose/L-ribulose 3-epimerase